MWLNCFIGIIPKETAILKYIKNINDIFSQDTLPKIFEALEAEETGWGKYILKRLKQCSPLMLHVTFRLQRIGRYLNSLEDALELEYRIAQHMIEYSQDFYEGIRARIIEPDTKPYWKHASIYDVTNEEITRFFDPVPEKLQLKSCLTAKRPSKDPYKIYIPEVANLLNERFNQHFLDRHIDRILPRPRTIEDIKNFYIMILQEGDFDEEAAEYYYTKDKYEELNEEHVDKEYLLHDEKNYDKLDEIETELEKNRPAIEAGLYKPTPEMWVPEIEEWETSRMSE